MIASSGLQILEKTMPWSITIDEKWWPDAFFGKGNYKLVGQTIHLILKVRKNKLYRFALAKLHQISEAPYTEIQTPEERYNRYHTGDKAVKVSCSFVN